MEQVRGAWEALRRIVFPGRGAVCLHCGEKGSGRWLAVGTVDGGKPRFVCHACIARLAGTDRRVRRPRRRVVPSARRGGARRAARVQ